MLSLHARRLLLATDRVLSEPVGDIHALLRDHLAGTGPGGLVLLGGFGSGKTSACARLAAESSDLHPASVVPLAVLGRAESVTAGLERAVGRSRLDEARAGGRVLLLDGFDEVTPPPGGYAAFFEELTTQVGPRWVLTSRPSHVRTSFEADPDQADSLSLPDVQTVQIEPLPRQVVREVITDLPNGRNLLATVDGLVDLATSPLLLHIILTAVPFIEPGRPIDAWGLFDAWLRYALHTGPAHAEVLARLETLAWEAFRDSGYGTETMSFHPDHLAAARLPTALRRDLMVTELDGRVRFGHRSVFEYLLAAHMAPRIAANQGRGPDELSGLRITDATRAFLVGRVPRQPIRVEAHRTRIPRGNFIAGGDGATDERPLRIQHLAEPCWLSRMPVTHADWQAFLTARPDDRQDALYLAHWGPERRAPADMADVPIYHLWPEDAEAYARWAGRPGGPELPGARLPTADEWEKAVRGVDGRRWPWGDHPRPGLAATSELGLGRPLPARALGAQGDAHLFGAVGGVFEYTSSHWRGREERGRVVMGGCFTHPLSTARASLRLSHRLSGHLKAGLRLAWNAE